MWREQLLLALHHAVFRAAITILHPAPFPQWNGDSEGTDGSRWRVRRTPPPLQIHRLGRKKVFVQGTRALRQLNLATFLRACIRGCTSPCQRRDTCCSSGVNGGATTTTAKEKILTSNIKHPRWCYAPRHLQDVEKKIAKTQPGER